MSFAALQRPAAGFVIEEFNPALHRDIADYDTLAVHHKMGCDVVVARKNDTSVGFIFRRFYIRSGQWPLPAMFVIYADDRDQLMALAGNIGRHFLARLAPLLIIDANAPIPGLTGFYTRRFGRRYFKGPHTPQLCDFRDSEFGIFGI